MNLLMKNNNTKIQKNLFEILINTSAFLLLFFYFLGFLARFSNIFTDISNLLYKVIFVAVSIISIIIISLFLNKINIFNKIFNFHLYHHIFIIIIIGFVSYFSFLVSPLSTCDDLLLIKNIQNVNSFIDCFKFSNIVEGGYRPLNNIKLFIILNYLKTPINISFYIFQFISIISHILIALIIYFICIDFDKNHNTGFISALIFVSLHSAIGAFQIYVDGIRDVTLFSLSTVLLLLKFNQTKKKSFYYFSIVTFLLALISKEHAIFIFPCILYLLLNEFNLKKILLYNLPFGIFSLLFLIIHYIFRMQITLIYSDTITYSWNILINIYKNIEWILLKQWTFHPNLLLSVILLLSILLILTKLKKTFLIFLFLWIFFCVWPTNFWPIVEHPHYNVERFSYIMTAGISILLGKSLILFNKNNCYIRLKNFLTTLIILPILLSSFIIYNTNNIWQKSGKLLNLLVYNSKCIYSESFNNNFLEIFLIKNNYYIIIWPTAYYTHYSEKSDILKIKNFINTSTFKKTQIPLENLNIIIQNRFIVTAHPIKQLYNL